VYFLPAGVVCFLPAGVPDDHSLCVALDPNGPPAGEPYGMRWVADYLFKAGWNVYSTILAGHAYKGAAWPTVALKPSLGGGDALAAAVARNPDLAAAVGDPASAAGDPAAAAQLFATLTTEVPALAGAGPLHTYLGALEPGGDPDAFAARFDSTAGDYGAVAEAALRHVAGLPGPVVAIGSSVGGAAALWAGAVGGGRVSHVLACAPLLRLYREDRRRMAMAVGPLGIGPEQGWSPTNRFPLSCFTGMSVSRGGGEWVMRPGTARIERLLRRRGGPQLWCPRSAGAMRPLCYGGSDFVVGPFSGLVEKHDTRLTG